VPRPPTLAVGFDREQSPTNFGINSCPAARDGGRRRVAREKVTIDLTSRRPACISARRSSPATAG